MKEILLNYITQALLGGASGYITNDYAINMLFKEYTFLKIGGVIKKTRHEFIENISSMVENDIVNKDKLQEILSDEVFKKEFENITADFYESSLFEAVGTKTFAQVEGFQDTVISTDVFVSEFINKHMPRLYKIIADNINLNDFLSTSQLDNISDALGFSLINIINDTNIVESFVLAVIKSNEELRLSSIINSDSKVVSNSVNLLLNAVSESDTEKIDELLTSIGVYKGLNSLIEVLGNKRVKEVLKIDCDVLKSVNEIFLNYVNSDKGINLISSLINSLFSYGKQCNKSIFQLLDTSFEENLKLYLIKNIPSLTENVVAWININSHLFDRIIEESIDEVIKESDSIKAKLLSVIKNAYLKDLSKKYSIANKIIAYVEKISEPEKLSSNLSNRIIEILNSLSVSEIIYEAEKNNITPENTENLILNYINKNSQPIINKAIDYISEIKLNKFLKYEFLNDDVKLNIVIKVKDIVSSNMAKDYLANKSTKYFENILSKELKELISDKKAKSIANSLKEFTVAQIKLNDSSLKSWFNKKTVTAVKELSSVKLDTNSINQLNSQLYKLYQNAAEDLKDVKLSAALDKLNSIDNLAKNSSESIRTYAAKNTDVILSGSIKAITTDNLNKLNDDELADLAKDFIGRELKPIMYFGGILGVAAGLILAAFQNNTLDFSGIKIANMAAYAFVGYITNVIAINMIFKPYKEKRLLSKIPFLRNFSLGYIIRNQKIFAKNTATFIDSSLLSKNSINELFDKYKDKIKCSFTRTISDNDYKALNNLIYNNKYNAAKSIHSFFKSKISSNVNNISIFIYNKISNIKIAYLLSEKTKNIICASVTEELQNPSLSKKAHSLISSDTILESKFSGNIIKKQVAKAGNNFVHKLSLTLSNENELNNIILKYEKNYANYIKKTINEIIEPEKSEKLADLTAEKICSIVLSKDSRHKITQKAISLVNKSIDRNKSFKEIFNGRFKDYIDSQMPKLLEKITSAVVNNLRENKFNISLMVQSEIKNHLGFIEKGMYTLMGGDEIVNELLAKVILVKIPRFLDEKKLEINSIVSILLEQKLYQNKVEVLYTGLNKLQLNEIVDSYLDTDNSLRIENKIINVTRDLFSKAENVKISNILKLLYADELKTLIETYKEEIFAFTNDLNSNLQDSKIQIIQNISNYTDILINKFMQCSFYDLFKGISEDDVKLTQDKVFKELYNNGFEKIIKLTLDKCKEHLSMNAGEFIDKNEFIRVAENSLITLIENEEFEKAIKDTIESLIHEAVSVDFNFLDNDTKDYLLNIFVESCISSLKKNLNEILKSIEFDKIASEEIEKMEPEKIHELFDSFAGKYFRRLMLYGLGGFVFGINIYVGFTLTIIKILSESLKKGPNE